MLKKLIIALLLSTSLVACSSKTQFIEKPVTQIHPEWPRPISALHTDWDIVELDDKLYVVAEYSSFLNLLVYQEDVLRYIKQSKNAMCVYRVDLNEEICKND